MSVSWVTKICLIIFAIAVLGTFGLNAKEMVKFNMADTLLTASAGTQSDPVRRSQCFAIYQPQLTVIANAYEHQHDSCLKAAQNAKVLINNEVASNYTEVQQLNTNICGGFSKCTQDHSDSYGFFGCNNEVAAKTTQLSYTIQSISKNRMQYITMRNEMITFDLNSCTDKCSHEYIAEHSRVFDELQFCLNGKDSVGSTTSITTSAGTTAPSSIDFPTPPTIVDD